MLFFTCSGKDQVNPGLPLIERSGTYFAQLGDFRESRIDVRLFNEPGAIVSKRLMRGWFAVDGEFNDQVIVPEFVTTRHFAFAIWHRIEEFGSPVGKAQAPDILRRWRIEDMRPKTRSRNGTGFEEVRGEETWVLLKPGEEISLSLNLCEEVEASWLWRFLFKKKYKCYWTTPEPVFRFDGESLIALKPQ